MIESLGIRLCQIWHLQLTTSQLEVETTWGMWLLVHLLWCNHGYNVYTNYEMRNAPACMISKWIIQLEWSGFWKGLVVMVPLVHGHFIQWTINYAFKWASAKQLWDLVMSIPLTCSVQRSFLPLWLKCPDQQSLEPHTSLSTRPEPANI